MKYLLPFLFALTAFFVANATNTTTTLVDEPEKALSSIERVPQFPGGDAVHGISNF